eukprot:774293-Prorocentrum_minimum.AAC.1
MAPPEIRRWSHQHPQHYPGEGDEAVGPLRGAEGAAGDGPPGGAPRPAPLTNGLGPAADRGPCAPGGGRSEGGGQIR